MKSQNASHVFRAALVLVAAVTASSCTSVDRVEARAEAMNRSLADYDNNATLLNIVRASLYEPLEFTSAGGIKGYNTYQAVIGLPTIIFGPHGAGALGGARDYSIGTSLTRASNNDFQISVVEDPASYQALLSPVNPAILGFFINQGYRRELVFNLFVDHVGIETRPGSNVFLEYANQPSTFRDGAGASQGEPETLEFQCASSHIQTWTDAGLTVKIDRSSIPGSKVIPAHRICFDRHLRGRSQLAPAPGMISDDYRRSCPDIDQLALANTLAAPNAFSVPDCDAPGGWTEAINLDAGAPPAGARAASSEKPASKPPQRLAAPGAAERHETSWTVATDDGRKFRLSMRSVFGVYRFLGRIVANKYDIFLEPGRRGDTLFRFTSADDDCFASIDYRGRTWCVPNAANYSKQTFGLLRQIVRLNATPTVQPVTQTVRAIP